MTDLYAHMYTHMRARPHRAARSGGSSSRQMTDLFAHANKRLLSVGTDGGGYITYYVPIKMISLMTAGAGRMEESLKREGLGAAAVPPPSSSALPEALALSAW
jgi:hypothetical protein